MGLATEQSDSGTSVLSPGPSLRQKHPKSSTRDSWNIPGTGMTILINGPMSGRVITMAKDGFMAGTSTTTTMTGRMLGESVTLVMSINTVTTTRQMLGKCKSDDKWRASQWETSSWSSSHWETSGWNETDKCSDDREGQQWSNHSFFETMNVDQLINSLGRGDDDAATFAGIEVDPGESLADTAAQSGSTFVRFGRPKRVSSTSLASNRVSSQARALEAKPRCWERWRCPPVWEASMA